MKKLSILVLSLLILLIANSSMAFAAGSVGKHSSANTRKSVCSQYVDKDNDGICDNYNQNRGRTLNNNKQALNSSAVENNQTSSNDAQQVHCVRSYGSCGYSQGPCWNGNYSSHHSGHHRGW